MLCCVAHICSDIKVVFLANCRVFTGTTLHYIVVPCVQSCLLCLKLLSYNRHMSCVTKLLLKRSQACKCRQGACLVATPVLASLVPSTFPGRARIICLFPSFAGILPVGLVVVRGPPSAAAW